MKIKENPFIVLTFYMENGMLRNCKEKVSKYNEKVQT
jgi:hypothetical protein